MLPAAAATEHPGYLASYFVPFGRGLPTDVRWDSSLGSEPASPGPLHQSAQRKHTPSALYDKGHCLAGRQMPAPDHKALLQGEACDF